MTVYKAYFDASNQLLKKKTFISGVIKKNENIIFQYTKEIQYRNNSNKAEYIALIKLLKYLKWMNISNIEIYGDNKSVIDRVNEDCRIKGRMVNTIKLNEEARKLLLSIPCSKLFWKNRKYNKEADKIIRNVYYNEQK